MNDQSTDAQTCGKEMAASAEIPRRWQALMDHVAANLQSHAVWVGQDSSAAKAEHDALMRVAGHYRAMARAAGEAVVAMTASRNLEPAPHDPSQRDAPAQMRWMRVKIQMQRELAELLVRHAECAELALKEEGAGKTW